MSVVKKGRALMSQKKRSSQSRGSNQGDRQKRRMFLETLEDRRLLAVGPQLIGIQPNDGELLRFDDPGQIGDIAPRELRFRFDENQVFSQGQYDAIFNDSKGIQITRSTLDGEFMPASVETDFGVAGIGEVRFYATRLGTEQNEIQLTFNQRDFGGVQGPQFGVAENRVDITLNVNANNETTAQELVDAINNLDASNDAVSSLIRAELLPDVGGVYHGDADIASGPVNYSPLELVGANDTVIRPGFVGAGDTSNELVVRFAETLVDDVYQVDIFGEGSLALRNATGEAFNDTNEDLEDDGSNIQVGFELDLGAQVVSVVPQPVVRQPDGSLVQKRDQIIVYFNDDDLSIESAENTNFYQLIYTGEGFAGTGSENRPTLSNADDEVIFPQSAEYNPELDAVLLTFANNIDDALRPSGTYRLRVGTAEHRPLMPVEVSPADDPGSTFTGFDDDGNRTVFDLASTWDTGHVIVLLGDGDSFVDGQVFSIEPADGSASQQFEFVNSAVGGVVDAGNIEIAFDSALPTTESGLATAIEAAVNGWGGASVVATVDSTGVATKIRVAGDANIMLDDSMQGLGLASEGVIVSEEITPPDLASEKYALQFPSAADEPGHRDIPIPGSMHVGGGDNVDGIETIQYNFRTEIGLIPAANGGTEPAYNHITEEQKERSREIFELISANAGVQFVETVDSGLIVATGDLRSVGCFEVACSPGIISAVGGVIGLAGSTSNGAIAIMDNAESWNDEFGGSWFSTATHEIGHQLGLRHAYDLPAVMGGGHTPGVEEGFPGNHDIAHLQHMMRPESNDIDMYEFNVTEQGVLTAETMAERLLGIDGEAMVLDTSVNLYQVRVQTDPDTGKAILDGNGQLQPILDSNGEEIKDLIGHNDDYFSKDSYLELELRPGKYYLGVTASGNSSYDPSVEDSGIGGRTQGKYDLRLNFRPAVERTLVDADNPVDPLQPLIKDTAFDGDANGLPGGVYNFWFKAAVPSDLAVGDEPRTIYVDKSAPVGGDGTLDHPFNLVRNALNVNAAGQPLPVANPNAVDPGRGGDILRILPNPGADADIRTEIDNEGYELGFNSLGSVLEDGSIFEVPRDVTVMIDAGAIFKMRRSWIAVGSVSTSPQRDHSAGVLQVLGAPVFVDQLGNTLPQSGSFATATPLDATPNGDAPDGMVHFTSYADAVIGLDNSSPNTMADKGDWGGIIFRNDIDQADQSRFDFESQGVFLNYVNHADMRYGGGEVYVESIAQVVDPITIFDSRPTISHNQLTLSRDAAIAATPNSFEETNFHSPVYQSSANALFTYDYSRVGPDISGNYIVDNTINGMFVSIETPATGQLQKLTVSAKLDDNDIVHVLQENLVIQSTPGGPFLETVEEQLDLVTRTPLELPGANLPLGTYSYRMVFVDANGFESRPTTATALTTTAASQNAIRLSQLLAAPEGFAARRLYRSTDGAGGAPWELISQINQSDTEYIDDGTTIGGELSLATERLRPRLDARLAVDPQVIVKLDGTRIEIEPGAQLIAEGADGNETIFTSLLDDRYGYGGTFDTTNDGPVAASPGNWGGLYGFPQSHITLDHVVIAYGGGVNRIEGDFAGFNAVEIHQADARIANSVLEFNANGQGAQGPATRFGREANAESVIFVRNSQPVIVDNTIRNNAGAGTSSAAISINANALNAQLVSDLGRSTGYADVREGFLDNHGPLIHDNRLDNNDINGVDIRGEVLTTASVWDDTTITHVLRDEIVVDDLHTYGGLRLQSNASASLVVKLQGANAGFVATGDPLEIDDRIGGAIQIVGQPKSPVILTSLRDDTRGSGVQLNGDPLVDTNNDGDATAPAPGDWNTILIDEYAHDANVDVVVEQESSDADVPGPNASAATAEYLGSLAINKKSGDDIRRLGFDVNGLISSPADIDVYSFEADAGTEVWVEFDYTTHAFDGILELIDGTGTVLARSVNSLAESNGRSSLYQNNSLSETAHVMGKVPGQGGTDYWQTNQRDPGFRLVMPGPVGTTSTYHLRVRSNTAPDRIHMLDAGISSGAYQMSIRLGERELFAGSTVRYSDIAYANTGITVLGQPIHSPLSGEKGESGNNNNRGTADFIGNVLAVDRGATSIAGRLNGAQDADWYEFNLVGNGLQGTVDDDPDPEANPGNTWSMTFDLDYADGLGRANTSLYLYDENGNLVAFSSDSNVADDQPQPGVDSKVEDLSRGSVGVTDPLIGPISLREGTYFMAVTTNQVTSGEMGQYLQANVGNPYVRLEPVNSVKRIAEDHLDVLGSAPHTTFENSEVRDLFDGGGRVVDWNLGDVTMYVLQNDPFGRNSSQVSTVDPFTGATEVVNFALSGWDLNDMAFDPANNLFSISTDADGFGVCNPRDASAGQYVQIDTHTGVVSDRGETTILTYKDLDGDPLTAERAKDDCGNDLGVGFHMDAMLFANNNLYAVGRRGDDGYGVSSNANASTGDTNPDSEWRSNVIFRLNPANGNAYGAHADATLTEAWTSHFTVGRIDLDGTTEPDAIVTGMAELNGDHYVVDNEGWLHQLQSTAYTNVMPGQGAHGFDIDVVSAGNFASVNVFERVGPDGAPIFNDLDLRFQGLVAPPALVEDGRYADLLFAVTDDGEIVAIQTDADHFGEVGRVFTNGDYMINTGLPNVRGLAFSNLEQNLFTVTTARGSADLLEGGINDNDKGHGIDTLVDGSRDDTLATLGPGAQSLAFSGASYDFNGGAHGTVISNEFSLRDISAGDRPTLYFTYFAQTDNAQDAFRAFISDNSGQWQPVAANNGAGTAMFDGTNTWRQARIPLTSFVGADHLRLRLDFSTAGDMNYGDALGGTEMLTHGSELYGIDGSYLRDGDSFTLTPNGFAFDIFELESGFTFVAPSGKAVPQGATVAVTRTDPLAGTFVTETFTFEKIDPALDTGGDTIFIAGSDDAADVVQKLASRLPGNFSHHINGERLNFEAVKIDNHDHPTLADDAEPGVTNVAVTGLPGGTVEGGDGVGSTFGNAHHAVWIHEGMTRVEIAAEIHDNLEDILVRNEIPESYRTEVDNDPDLVEADGFKIWNDMVRIIGYDVITHGPLGYHDGTLAGDVDGETAGYHNVARFNNNAFNGVFIDDVIVAMAGRGEMVVSAAANDAFVTNTESLGDEVVEGTYQLEIRRSSEVLDAGFNPVRSWHMDDRITDGTSVTVSSGAYIHDGEFFDISDGVSTVRFEYEDTLLGDGVQSGNVAIPFDSTLEDWEVTRAVRDAINRFEVNALIDVTAGLSDGTINDPTNDANTFPDLRVDPVYTPASTTNVVNLFGDAYLVNDPSDRGIPRPALVGEFNDTILSSTHTTIMGANTRYVASGNIGDNEYWSLEPSADVDLFQIQMTAGEELNIRVDAESIESNLDAVLRVFSSAGVELAREDDTNGLDPELTFVAPAGGLQVFYVGLSSVPDSMVKVDFPTTDLYDPNTLDTTGVNKREVGLILRDSAGDPLREEVGDYRISMSFDTASLTFDSAVALQDVIYDNFRADPEWTGGFFAFNPPGYQADSSEATGEEFAGEIGGEFNVNLPGFYADTGISGLTLNDRIVGRGRLDHTAEFNPDFDAPMVLGHFDLTGADDGTRLALGISFSRGPAFELAWHAYLGGTTGGPNEFGTRGPQIELDENVGLDWTYTWNPSGGAEGAGQLTVNLNGEVQSLDMTTAQRIEFQEASVNAFGFWHATDTGGGSADIFVDDVYYTGTPQDNWGDSNLLREQGQVLLQANTISHSAGWGILSDEGTRNITEGNSSHMGPVRNLDELNTERLVPGVAISNNLLHGNEGGGIRFSGTTTQPIGAVPFGRIINNTVYGTGNGETGIQVDENASPTILNNILANLGTGIDVDGTSDTTIVAASVYQGNTDDINGVLEEFSMVATDPLFIDVSTENFYLSGGSAGAPNPAIDSSVSSLEDRYGFVLVKDPLGIARSPVIAPVRDMRGQLRVDDPSSEPVGGMGQNVFIDRGAIDASDFSGPTARLIEPLDNDPLGVDSNTGLTVVNLDNEVVSSFEIRLNDGQAPADSNEGIGIADSTVTADKVIVQRDGVVLENNVDYSFSYNANNDTIRLTPLAGIWPQDAIYTINLINRDQWSLVAPHWDMVQDGDQFRITDLAGNQSTFEFEYGYVINVPQTTQIQVNEVGASFGGIVDGDRLTVSNTATSQSVVFEFDDVNDGQTNYSNGGDHVLIPFTPSVSTQADIAQLIVQNLTDPITLPSGAQVSLGLAVVDLGEGRIHLGTRDFHSVELQVANDSAANPSLATSGQLAGVIDGEHFSVDDGSQLVTFEFDEDAPADVGAGNLVISIDQGDTNEQIADALVTEITAAGLGLTPFHLGEGRVFVGGTINHQLTVNPTETSLTSVGEPGVTPELSLKIPTVAGGFTGIEDGEEFTISDGFLSVTFELNNTDVDPGLEDSGNTRIDFNNSSSVSHLASQIVLAIKSAGLNLDAVHEAGTPIVRIVNSTTSHTINVSNTSLVQLGEPGVPATTAVNLTEHFEKMQNLSFDDRQIAVAILDALDQDTQLSGVAAQPAGGAEVMLTGVETISDIARQGNVSWETAFDVPNPSFIAEIEDLAANPLKPNQLSGETKFTITLGSVSMDYGDAADGLGQAPQNSYPVLSDSDAAIHLIPDQAGDTLWLGSRVDRDSEGQSQVMEVAGDAGVMVDGEQFTITRGTRSEVFEFDTDGSVAADTMAINVTGGQSAETIAETVATAINAANLGMYVRSVGGGRLLLGSNYDIDLDGAPTNLSVSAISGLGDDLDGDGYTLTSSGSGVTLSSAVTPASLSVVTGSITDGDVITISNGLITTTFEFDEASSPGVVSGNFAVPYAAIDSNNEVATALVASIKQAVVDADLELNLSPIQSGADVELSGDDEDGVSNPDDPSGPAIGFLSPYVQRDIVVTASSDGLLDAWIDFNRDGDWDDAQEQIFASQQLLSGPNTLTIITPNAPDYEQGNSFARFRFSSTGGLLPTGLTSDGETEDYPVILVPGTPPIPVADPDSLANPAHYATDANVILSPPTSLLANDTDFDNDDFRILDPAAPNDSSGAFTVASTGGATVTLDRAYKTTLGGGAFSYDSNVSGATTLHTLAGEYTDPSSGAVTPAEVMEDTFTYNLIEAVPYEFVSQTEGVVTITVTGVNDPPVASMVTASAFEDGATIQGSFNGDDVDSDDDGLSLIYNVTVAPSAGTLVNNGNGTFNFSPGSGFQELADGATVEVDFTYTAKDRHDELSVTNPDNGKITLTGVNDAPFAGNDNYLVDQDAVLDSSDVSVNSLFQNDVDVDNGDTLTLKSLNGGSLTTITTQKGATLTVTPTGEFVYDPTTSAVLKAMIQSQWTEDVFTYEVEDLHGEVSTGIVTIVVSGVNNAPEPGDDTYQVDQDEVLTTPQGNLAGVLANDTDPDLGDHILLSRLQGQAFPGGSATVTGTSVQGATVTLNLNGTLTYDPTISGVLSGLNGGQQLVDTFTYAIVDDFGLEGTATVSVTVLGVNKGPTTVDDFIITGVNEDTQHIIPDSLSHTGVLLNDTDPEGDAFSVTGVNGVAQLTGTTTKGAAVTLTPNGGLTYNPTNATALQALAEGVTTVDTFTYTATDVHGGSNEATVSITVDGINDLPVAANDTVDVPRNATTAITILSNDVDVDGLITLVCQVAGPTHGVLQTNTVTDPGCSGSLVDIVGDTVNYTPDGSYSGPDQFTYRVKDDTANGWSTATATVIIEVNDPPNAEHDVYNSGTGVTDPITVYQNAVNIVDVLANDTDSDGTLIATSVTVVTSPVHGTTVEQADGTIFYTPTVGVAAGTTDTFSYQVQDDDGAWSNIANVNLLIQPDPTPWQNKPVAEDVNDDGTVSPLDALIGINAMNAGTYPGGTLPVVSGTVTPPPFYDVETTTTPGILAPIDVLVVINWLNDNATDIGSSEGEGEGQGEWLSQAVHYQPVRNVPVAPAANEGTNGDLSDDGCVISDSLLETSDWQRLSRPLSQAQRSPSYGVMEEGEDWEDWLNDIVDDVVDARHQDGDTDLVDDVISRVFLS